ncbi:MAG TPA: PAS domain S-box protein [Humidesulfovibrio sp.]|uniref:PAS domain S-box protein n=1 Tax=Humidesulfovibrio sp. TaxID=2910988 RepID=UPI002D1BAD78|nr:PAS domain S-box protein [Humidesulfovibrio sp.]HWR05167.1 PAS domain S-box protein [Humidesulfovibrio sp.]
MNIPDNDIPPEDWAKELPDGSVFRVAFESSQTVMFLIDPLTAKVIGANKAACEFYGYQPEELEGLSAADISLLSNENLCALLQGINQGGSKRFSSRHRLKTGQLRDMELDAAPITLHNGRSCLFFIGHDVTPRLQAERSLYQRESLLRAILESAVDGIGYKDAQGIYREANKAFCQLVGRPCEEIIGRRAKDFFDRRAADRHVEMDRRIMDQRQPVAYELTQERPDGTRYLSVHKSPVCDAAGECLGVVSVSHDITERRLAEAALSKSEGLLRAMLQSAQDSIFVTDEHDVLRELNQSFCARLGRRREELLDRPLSEVFSGDELRIQLSTNSLARETREPVSFTQRLAANEQECWLSVVKTAVVDAEGRCLGVVAMGRDITAQHVAELALRQSERRLSGLIRQAPVGVFETDAKGMLVFANERMQRQTGRTQEALAGNRWLESIVREDREDFLALWHETLADKRELESEVRMLDARGVRQWMSCRIRPMTDAANRFSGYLGVLGDISERKKAEALRTDVESVVRHDLKSPLGSVQNAMELLELLGPLTPEQTQVLTEVRILTRRMQDLISLSLDLHAMEAGAFKPVLGPVDLCDVVETQRAELRPLVEGKGLRLNLVSDCPQGPFYVSGERRLLDAVFSNLLKNAAEASPDGAEITVRLENESPLAEVFIRNKGEVPKGIRERFFEKYATSGKPHGTGLGTYSARLMVRTMGGTLSLNTEEPGATTLILRLPAADPAKVCLLAPERCPV